MEPTEAWKAVDHATARYQRAVERLAKLCAMQERGIDVSPIVYDEARMAVVKAARAVVTAQDTYALLVTNDDSALDLPHEPDAYVPPPAELARWQFARYLYMTGRIDG